MASMPPTHFNKMVQIINYDKYHAPLLDYDNYFKKYFGSATPGIQQKHLTDIYKEYACKHNVFNRDSFICQVVDCKFNDSPITIHHYKHKSNGGKWAPRNCISVCRAHQAVYHHAKGPLTFVNAHNLPPRIKGATQVRDLYFERKPIYIAPALTKQEKAIRNKVRKDNRNVWNKTLNWHEILLLLNFLFSNFNLNAR